jgi:hypothetical protein
LLRQTLFQRIDSDAIVLRFIKMGTWGQLGQLRREAERPANRRRETFEQRHAESPAIITISP